MPSQYFYIITVGFRCNNNCLMCSVDNFRKKFSDRTTDDIIAELRRGRSLGFESVEFTGGEPTVRPDFLFLVYEAKKLGYKIINTGTNGRVFSYTKFCREAFKRGLTGVNFALHGSSARLHDAITRTPGSFRQSIQGIKNVLKEPTLKDVYLLSVIFRLNLEDVGGLVKLTRSLGIKHWNLLNLIPEGAAAGNYRHLVVPLVELARKFNGNFSLFGLLPEISFFDFPPCLFNPAFHSDKSRFQFITVKDRKENAMQVGYGVKSPKKAGTVYIDKRRSRLPICRLCCHSDECGGVWKEYIRVFGQKIVSAEIAELVRQNNCLSR